MSTITASPANAGTDTPYVQNVVRAARSFLAALFAVKPRPATEPGEETITSRDLARLYRMARQYDSVMPNLARELNAIAARSH